MECSYHTINELFDQLGLPSSDNEIESFIDTNKPLKHSVKIQAADCFSKSQQTFIEEAFHHDSDWVVAVEHLDAMLRESKPLM